MNDETGLAPYVPDRNSSRPQAATTDTPIMFVGCGALWVDGRGAGCPASADATVQIWDPAICATQRILKGAYPTERVITAPAARWPGCVLRRGDRHGGGAPIRAATPG
jgi:hypothetical protein